MMLSPPSVPPPNNWYVITGGPCTGKTTLINLLAQHGFHVVNEHARQRIDREVADGLTVEAVRRDQIQFQRAVLEMQLEHESNTPPEQLTFFDRGVPDTLAYHRFHQLEPDPFMLRALARCAYRQAFLLAGLPFVPDYARQDEDQQVQQEIERLLVEVYSALPIPLVRVPVLPPEERMRFVLEHL